MSSSPKHYNKFPIETILANSHATVNALELARTQNAKIVLGSSAAVYGFYRENSAIREEFWLLCDQIKYMRDS